jgi:thiol:disulfide interchange protein
MKALSSIGVLGTALTLSTLLFAGCSQNVRSVDNNAPQPESTPANVETPQPESAKPSIKAPSLTQPPKARPAKATKITWKPTLVAAMNEARAKHKPIMADFFATWCGPCKHLDTNIYTAPAVIQESENFISVRIDVDKNMATAQQYQIGPIPTIIFLDENGKQIVRYEGAPAEAETFLEWMQDAHSKSLGTAA